MLIDVIRARSAKSTFNILTEKLQVSKKLYFVRFGDGEIIAMQQKAHRNYNPSAGLAKEIKESFAIKHPDYLVALTANMPKEKYTSKGVCYQYPQNQDIINYVMLDNNICEPVVYENPFIFHYMALFHPIETKAFFDQFIRPKTKMFIGGASQLSAEALYGKIDYYIQIPSRHAYDSIDDWWPRILENIDKVELVLPAAGAATNVIAKRLWQSNYNIQLLDIGSLIDAVEQRSTRVWIRLLGHRINQITENKGTLSFKNSLINKYRDTRYFFRRNILTLTSYFRPTIKSPQTSLVQRPFASVIISFYNNIPFLELLLEGFKHQSFKNFEIIIADDGSSPNTINSINELIKNSSLDIKHCWHNDQGWRKNIILNKAAGMSTTNYLIFIDGDCIPHKHFVREHIKHADKNHLLTGRRVNLSKEVANRINKKMIQRKSFGFYMFLMSFINPRKDLPTHPENSIYFNNPLIKNRLNKKDKGILGSNFSLYKEDLLKVNGFDERYKAPTVGEDTDLEIRLRNTGLKVKTLKFLAIQYHLYHKRISREHEKTNLRLLQNAINNKTTYTPFGINKNKVNENENNDRNIKYT